MLRDKVIESKIELYFTLGYSPDGRVNVTSATGGDFLLTPAEAQQLIAERQAAYTLVEKLANALNDVAPDVFNDVWYNQC